MRLTQNKNTQSYSVHRLVLIAFKGDAPKPMEVNHINGNKRDNSLKNLEWVTHGMNLLCLFRSGKRIGKRGEQCNLAKLTQQQVNEIREALSQREKQKQIAKAYGVHQSAISRIKNNLRWIN